MAGDLSSMEQMASAWHRMNFIYFLSTHVLASWTRLTSKPSDITKVSGSTSEPTQPSRRMSSSLLGLGSNVFGASRPMLAPFIGFRNGMPHRSTAPLCSTTALKHTMRSQSARGRNSRHVLVLLVAAAAIVGARAATTSRPDDPAARRNGRRENAPTCPSSTSLWRCQHFWDPWRPQGFRFGGVALLACLHPDTREQRWFQQSCISRHDPADFAGLQDPEGCDTIPALRGFCLHPDTGEQRWFQQSPAKWVHQQA